jgi:hypothetical protein
MVSVFSHLISETPVGDPVSLAIDTDLPGDLLLQKFVGMIKYYHQVLSLPFF